MTKRHEHAELVDCGGVLRGELVQPLLKNLVRVTQSNVALLRNVDHATQKLELVAFALGGDVPPFSDGFRIPFKKGFKSCRIDNPADSWGTSSFYLQPFEPGSDFYVEGELAFVE